MKSHTDPLDSIIGDEIRVKLLRIFVLNKDSVYAIKDFVKVLRKSERSVRIVLKSLEGSDIIRRKKISSSDRKSKGSAEVSGYGFNKWYTHREFLEKIVRVSIPTEKDILAEQIVRLPGVQYVVTANVFVEKSKKFVDLVVASSENNEPELKDLVRRAEKVIGRELRCVFLTVNDLMHRVRMNDRFIRGILEEEHYCVHLDKIGLSE